jgi:uncharacterized membrane protein HdeD (DUF308 family)
MTDQASSAHSHSATQNPAAVLECPAGRWWVCALLGIVLFALGVFVVFNAVAASLVSAIFFGAAMLVGGIFQMVHAFSARGWGSIAVSFLVGLLFAIGGGLLMLNPLATSLGLTLAFAAMLIASGVMRLVLAYRHWRDYGWLLVASGLLGLATGAVLLAGFPWSGLVVPGLLLGFDLMMHGVWWLVVGAFVRRPRDASAFTTPSGGMVAAS